MHVTVNVIVALKNNFITENFIKRTDADLPQFSFQTICSIIQTIYSIIKVFIMHVINLYKDEIDVIAKSYILYIDVILLYLSLSILC